MATIYYDNDADLSLIRAQEGRDRRLRLAGPRARAQPAATAASTCASAFRRRARASRRPKAAGLDGRAASPRPPRGPT